MVKLGRGYNGILLDLSIMKFIDSLDKWFKTLINLLFWTAGILTVVILGLLYILGVPLFDWETSNGKNCENIPADTIFLVQSHFDDQLLSSKVYPREDHCEMIIIELVVDHYIPPDTAKETAENFIRLLKAIGPDDPPGMDVGRGRYFYNLYMMTPDDNLYLNATKSQLSKHVEFN
ncbi:MAG: hypothetical protein F4073_04430 [Rhodobacteraceae bacterium]|nr:hypothetical protein [Paracoccaceae bacterium]MYI91184.1 hypothetical protein [Paracoccaceae bacterium]MYJ86297.1 hypothetical protein [Paracoccaceae bacterium]